MLISAFSYYCRYFLVGTVTATDHLMLAALVRITSDSVKYSLTTQTLTWANLVVNYYQDETSSHTRPKFYSIPV